MNPNQTSNRRGFLGDALREALGAVKEAQECFRQAAEEMDFFESPDSSFTLTRHYPREIYEDEAKRLGIDIDEVGIDEAVRRIFAHHGYQAGA